MAEYSIGDLKALMDNDNRGFGDAGFLWIILIFLFFLAFSGDGLFGGGANGLEQTQRDILTTSCETQKGTLESQYNTLLGFKDQQLQLSECCCENRLAICQQTNALATAIHAEGEETRADRKSVV